MSASTVLDRVREGLDRPGGRAALAALATGLASWRNRGWCRVRFVDACGWSTRFADDETVWDERVRTEAPSSSEASLSDIFCHGYRPTIGDTVVDVGAGIGLETLMFSRQVGADGRVISIEGSRRVYGFLDRTIRGSRRGNVEWINAAVGVDPGLVLMSEDQQHTWSHVVDRAAKAQGTAAVPGLTLDDLHAGLGLSRVALLKMNIEGAEVDALRGAEHLLAVTDNVVVSCHDFIADTGGPESLRTYETVAALLESAGFSLTRRVDDPRPEVRYYLYGHRATGGVTDGLEQETE